MQATLAFVLSGAILEPMLPAVMEMLERLVSIPSVSSIDESIDQSNRGVIDLLAQWTEDLGFDVRVEAVRGIHPKFNLIATLGEGTDGLVLSGHTDTVPFDAEEWTSDPLTLTEREGKLFGLGTTDMKGFFAAALHAVARFKSEQLRRPIRIVATSDEESTMAGARALMDSGECLGAYAVIGEPTGLQPIYKHKGMFPLRCSIRGESGHASYPDLGVNAISGMHRALAAIEKWAFELAERYRDDDFEVPNATLNLGRIEGGDSFNRIAAYCTADLELRLLPGMDREEILQELRSTVQACLIERRWSFEITGTDVYVPPFFTAIDTPFAKKVQAGCGCVAASVMFGTESPFLAELGLETLVVGAGDIRVAHKPDEYITMSSLCRASEFYAELIQSFCIES